jgi:hemerythrin
MPIRWRKQMSIGHLIIDLDHRYLKMAHQRPMKRQTQITDDILSVKDPERLTECREQIVPLLRNWLLDHVLKEDTKMKANLDNLPPNAVA